MTTALRLSNLAYSRNQQVLFEALSLELEAGQGLIISGANGSGKTSLLRILAGLVPAAEGQIDKPAELHYLGHQPGLKSYLSVEENLVYSHRLASLEVLKSEQVNKALTRSGLLPFRKKQAAQLSAGQKRRLALSRLLVSDKSLWLLDEPFTNLDQEGQLWLLTLIEEQLAKKGMVIFTSHQPLAEHQAKAFKTLHLKTSTHV